MDVVRRGIKGVFFNGISYLIQGLLGILIVPFIVHSLGVEKYGVYVSYSIFYTTGFLSLFELGFLPFIQRLESVKRQEKNDISIYIVTLLISLLVYVLAYLIVLVFLRDYVNISKEVWLLLSFFPIGLIYLFLDSIAKRYLLYKISNMSIILQEVVKYSLVVILVIVTKDVTSLVFAVGIAWLISSAFLMKNLKKYVEVKSLSLSYGWLILRENVAFIKNMFIGRASSVVFNSTDKVLVFGMLSVQELAYYDILTKLPLLLQKVYSLSVGTLAPVSAYIGSIKNVLSVYKSALPIVFVVLSFLALNLFVWSDELIKLWIDSNFYFERWHIAILLLWAVSNAFLFMGNMLVGLDFLIKQITWFRVIQGLMKVGLSILLIGLYSLDGLFYAFSAQICYNFMFMIYFHKRVQIKFLDLATIGDYLYLLILLISVSFWSNAILVSSLSLLLVLKILSVKKLYA